MREIKFRVWKREVGEMHYFPLVSASWLSGMTDLLETVMQYTGLKDETGEWISTNKWNGKKIYENDIITGYDGITTHQTHTGVVEWDERGFWWVRPIDGKKTDVVGNTLHGWLSLESPRVIGNIYENPELLKS